VVQINSETANIPSVAFTEQGSDIAAPSAGYAQAYVKSGIFYVRNSSGIWTPMANPMTTQDDVIVGGASGVPGRLAKGTDGQVLTVDPSTHHLLWATPASAGSVATDAIWDAAGDLAVGSGSNAAAKLSKGSDGQVLSVDPSDHAVKWMSGGGGLYDAYLCYADEKAQNTQSGTFTSGAWRTRTLNTERADTAAIGTLSSNEVTLPAGTYRVLAHCPAYQTNRHQARLYDVTGAAALVIGMPGLALSGAIQDSVSTIQGRFTLSVESAIRLEHWATTSMSNQGFGIEGNITTEVYAVLELWRES